MSDKLESQGQELRAYIRAAGTTQAKLAEAIGVDPTYISQMVNDKVNWVNSAYFSAIVDALSIPESDVRRLKPSSVIMFTQPPAPESQPEPVDIRSLPDGLREAIEVYGERFEDLVDPAWQRYLATFQWRTGQPEEAERWLDLYRDLARAGVVPGGSEL